MAETPGPNALATEKPDRSAWILANEQLYTDGWRARMRRPDDSKYGRLASIRPGSYFDIGWQDAQRKCWARHKDKVLRARIVFVRDPRQKVMNA